MDQHTLMTDAPLNGNAQIALDLAVYMDTHGSLLYQDLGSSFYQVGVLARALNKYGIDVLHVEADWPDRRAYCRDLVQALEVDGHLIGGRGGLGWMAIISDSLISDKRPKQLDLGGTLEKHVAGWRLGNGFAGAWATAGGEINTELETCIDEACRWMAQRMLDLNTRPVTHVSARPRL